MVREIRRLGLLPACQCCRSGTQLTTEIDHEPGAELQLDWLELHETPWARKAYVLVGVLPHSGRLRGVFSEGMSFAHLAAALDQLLRRFGGSARCWRTDRMATFVFSGTDRLRSGGRRARQALRRRGLDLPPPSAPSARARSRRGSIT